MKLALKVGTKKKYENSTTTKSVANEGFVEGSNSWNPSGRKTTDTQVKGEALQRNVRIHDNVFISVESILSLICNDVRLRISSLQKVVDKPMNRAMCERWSFPLTILRSN